MEVTAEYLLVVYANTVSLFSRFMPRITDTWFIEKTYTLQMYKI